MGYIFQHQDAAVYDRQQETPGAMALLAGQRGLLQYLLQPHSGQRFLDVGCGGGHLLQLLDGAGLQLTGLEGSSPMLEYARARLARHVDLHHAMAEELPFEDNAFHYVSLMHTLEFVEDPVQALAEACRVASQAVFIGLINKHATLAAAYRLLGLCMPTIYNRARFFSIWQVRQFVAGLLGQVPFKWRTVYFWPPRMEPASTPVVPAGWRNRLPFGILAGIKIVPVPCFKTTPLTLKLKIKSRTGQFVGSGPCNGAHQLKPEGLEKRSARDGG